MLLVSSCRKNPTASVQAAPAAPSSTATEQAQAAPPAALRVVADVDLGTITVADVRARMRSGNDDDVLQAIGAAVLDALALRELAVLDLRPQAGEARTVAVDRLLRLAFTGQNCVDIAPENLRLRYLERLATYRHPRKFTVWEAFLDCCPGTTAACPPDRRTACLAAHAGRANALSSTLMRAVVALDPPVALTPTTLAPLATTAARVAAIPAFERVVANAGAAGVDADTPAFALRRYTFFGRGDPRFPERAFRRADTALEAAVSALPTLGAVTLAIETQMGWSVAALMAHEPMRWRNLEDPDVQRALSDEACAAAADQARDAWLERVGRAAHVRWHEATITDVFGEGVTRRLPVWRAKNPLHVPEMER